MSNMFASRCKGFQHLRNWLVAAADTTSAGLPAGCGGRAVDASLIDHAILVRRCLRLARMEATRFLAFGGRRGNVLALVALILSCHNKGIGSGMPRPL